MMNTAYQKSESTDCNICSEKLSVMQNYVCSYPREFI